MPMRRVVRIVEAALVIAIMVAFGNARVEGTAGPTLAGSWRSGEPMPPPRTEVTAGSLDGVMYVIGGFRSAGGNSDVVEAYDIASDTWSTKAPLPQRLDHAGVAAVAGKVYVVGGYANFAQGQISPTTYEYDPNSDQWTTRAPMPLARAAAATVELSGVLYVLGGVGQQATVPLAFAPAANSWSQLAPMSAEREHLTASVADGKVYVIGGRQNVTQNVATNEAYDPATNTWQPLAPMPAARGGLASDTLLGRVHVVGGEDLWLGGSTFSEQEVYEPATDSWLKAPSLPTARHGLAAKAANSQLYVIGGGLTPGLSASNAVEIFALDAVGGIAELPDSARTARGAGSDSIGGWRILVLAAAGAIAAALALGPRPFCVCGTARVAPRTFAPNFAAMPRLWPPGFYLTGGAQLGRLTRERALRPRGR